MTDLVCLQIEMLDILACLNMWLTDLYEYGDSRQSKREETSKKITTIKYSALELSVRRPCLIVMMAVVRMMMSAMEIEK